VRDLGVRPHSETWRPNPSGGRWPGSKGDAAHILALAATIFGSWQLRLEKTSPSRVLARARARVSLGSKNLGKACSVRLVHATVDWACSDFRRNCVLNDTSSSANQISDLQLSTASTAIPSLNTMRVAVIIKKVVIFLTQKRGLELEQKCFAYVVPRECGRPAKSPPVLRTERQLVETRYAIPIPRYRGIAGAR
jgi:hypothetical protein